MTAATLSGKDPHLFFRDLEQQARNYQVRTVRVTGTNNSFIGLVLVAGDLSGAEMAAALTSLSGDAGRHDSILATPLTGLTEATQFKRLLSLELARVQRTRLPCALILLELDNFSVPGGQTAERDESVFNWVHDLVLTQVHALDIVGRCAQGPPASARSEIRLGIILPGTNFARALQRAQRVQQAVRAKPMMLGENQVLLTSSMGIAICHAGINLTANDFISQAAAELERAQKNGGNSICHGTTSNPDDACQVSVEEKTQLFSFLTKEAGAS